MARRSRQTTVLFDDLQHGNATRDAVRSKSSRNPSTQGVLSNSVAQTDWQSFQNFLAAWDRGHDMYTRRQQDNAENARWAGLSIDDRALELFGLIDRVKESVIEMQDVFEQNPECFTVEAMLNGLYRKLDQLEAFDVESEESPYIL